MAGFRNVRIIQAHTPQGTALTKAPPTIAAATEAADKPAIKASRPQIAQFAIQYMSASQDKNSNVTLAHGRNLSAAYPAAMHNVVPAIRGAVTIKSLNPVLDLPNFSAIHSHGPKANIIDSEAKIGPKKSRKTIVGAMRMKNQAMIVTESGLFTIILWRHFPPNRSSSVTMARMQRDWTMMIKAAVICDHNSMVAPRPRVSVIK